TSYAWNFGDGSSAATSAPTTSHIYAAAGSYTTTLTETDSAGTSTTQVFTGQTMSRDGGPSAQTTRPVSVTSALQATASALTPSSLPNLQPAPPTSVVISAGSLTTTARGDALIWVRCPATARDGCRGTITIALAERHSRRARAVASRCARGCRSLGS